MYCKSVSNQKYLMLSKSLEMWKLSIYILYDYVCLGVKRITMICSF
eukprot:UN08168